MSDDTERIDPNKPVDYEIMDRVPIEELWDHYNASSKCECNGPYTCNGCYTMQLLDYERDRAWNLVLGMGVSCAYQIDPETGERTDLELSDRDKTYNENISRAVSHARFVDRVEAGEFDDDDEWEDEEE